VSRKRLRQRAHRHVSKDSKRLILAPLEEVLKGALASKPNKDESDQQAPLEVVDAAGS
jgi:hypothetical protein